MLAVARTFTSAVRLLEALAVFRRDARVEVLFALDDSSAFSVGVDALLERAGVRLVPWHEIAELGPDLVLMASENVPVRGLDAPVLVLPHGIGFHKYVPDSRGPGRRLSGVVPADRLGEPGVWMAISHPEQREQLRAEHPEAARRCVLIGDLALDRMAASAALRDRYRDALGVGPGQRLVVVSSTWGPGSLLARRRTLPARLLGALPADEYRVALVAHPNVWSWHGPHQLGLWLADAFDAGLVRVPPEAGWQAALLAADVVVGDQGSVSLYATALPRPFLLAAGDGPVVPASPAGELARLAVRLDDAAPLAGQVARAAAQDTDRLLPLADRMFGARGRTAATLRAFVYELLELAVPDGDAPLRAVPPPEPAVDEPRSFVVHSRAEADGALAVRRWPAAVADPGPAEPGAFRHLSVGDDEPDRRLPDNATVLVRRAPLAGEAAAAWLSSALDRHPELLVAVTALADGGCAALLRDGSRVRATGTDDPALAGTALYHRVRAGEPADGSATIRVGPRTATLSWTCQPG